MARVPQYTAQRGLDTDRRAKPQPRFTAAGAQAAAALGGAVADVGENLIRRENQIARVKAAAGLDALGLQGSEIIQSRYENIDEAGQGFLLGVQKEFNKKRDTFLKGLPDNLREEFAARSEAVTGRVDLKAAGIERQQSHSFSERVISSKMDELSILLDQDPENHETIQKEGLKLIDDLGAGLPTNKRLKFQKDWIELAALTREMARMRNDPDYAERYAGPIRASKLPGSVQQRGNIAMEFFIGRGYSRVQAAGIVGNLIQESGMRPHGAVGDNGTAFGLAQWRGKRHKALKDFAAVNRADWRDFHIQLAFIDHELRTSETAAHKRLRSAETIDEATAAFISYERPKGWTAGKPRDGHGYRSRLSNAVAFAQGSPVGFSEDIPDDLSFAGYQTLRNSALKVVSADNDDFLDELNKDIRKTGYELIADDTITDDWVEANRDVLTVSDYKTMKAAANPNQNATVKTSPEDYVRLLDQVEENPELAREEVRELYLDGQVSKDVFSKIISRASARENEIEGPSFHSQHRSYVRKMLAPSMDDPKSYYSRQLDAINDFDDWLVANPEATREEARKFADQLVADYRKVRYGAGDHQLPVPPGLEGIQNPTAADVQQLGKNIIQDIILKTQTELRRTGGDPNNASLNTAIEMGIISKRELARRAALLRIWHNRLKNEESQP
ncbi:phage tail tip lysozyme [Hoeflea sp. TYP-13]|uniref:phage tail tip lysozyme n=1 Tax=Hoeflea sp. TYP-13 TaxID=3230023 RepID=UPI0034C673B4